MRKAVVEGGGIALVLVVAVFMLGIGCAPKQSVRSAETATAAGAPAGDVTAPETRGGAAAAQPGREKITSESVRAESAPRVARAESAPMVAAAGVAVTEERKSPFQDIHFDFDKSLIRDEDKPVLAKIAEQVKKNGGMKILIEGHCDERGTSEYNMALGERRAASTRAYLASLGVSKGGLSTVSYGKEKPIDSGHNDAAWAKNRRAHFVVR